MERYLGIDVHRDSSTICVISASGKATRRDIVETSGQTLVRYVKQLAGSLHVCIEESTWSEWLYEILTPHVAELVVFQRLASTGVSLSERCSRRTSSALTSWRRREPSFDRTWRSRRRRAEA